MKKILPIMIILIIIAGAVAFYGGMKYAASRKSNLSAVQRQQFGQIGQNGAFVNRQNGASAVNGQIVSKNDQNMTVQLRDGNSKIVFYSSSTEVSKFVAGASGDLVVGDTVMISGTTNSDGSLTAQSVQIRPDIPATTAPNNTPTAPVVQ